MLRSLIQHSLPANCVSLANIDSWGIWKSTSCSSRHDKLWDITYTPDMPCVSPGWSSSWICTISFPSLPCFSHSLAGLFCKHLLKWIICTWNADHIWLWGLIYGSQLRIEQQLSIVIIEKHYHSRFDPLPPLQKQLSLYKSRGNWTAAMLLKSILHQR